MTTTARSSADRPSAAPPTVRGGRTARRALAATALAALAAVATPLAAQPAADPAGGRPPARVLVVLADELPSPAALAVAWHRRGGGAHRHVVVLRRGDDTPEALAAALAAVNGSRRAHGDDPARDVRADVARGAVAAIPAAARERLLARLAELRSAPRRRVDGVATGPAVELTLAAPRGR